ncbi:MAG: transposase [Bacteroidota bacterium]
MPSHIHMIIGRRGEPQIQHIIRDLKSFTSRSIRKVLEDTNRIHESRRKWMLRMMYNAGMLITPDPVPPFFIALFLDGNKRQQFNSANIDFQFRQQNSHAIELSTNDMIEQRLEYIHLDPVKAGFVDLPEAWPHSSAKDYAGVAKGLIDLIFI